MLSKQQRELIIKLDKDGLTQQRVSHLIGCSQAAVSKWISKHKAGRTLETLPRSGRPTKLSKERLDKLRTKLIIEVKKANKEYCSLSTKELVNMIKEEIGRAYSIRHVERLMHRMGFSLITPRPSHIRHDQGKVDKFKDDFKKNLRRNIWVMSS